MNFAELTPSSIVARNEEILSTCLGEETVMMDIESGNYFGLGLIGSRIWQLIETPNSIQQILDSLLAEYEVEKEQCLEDIIDFLDQLAQNRIVLTK
ncbi:lasso peptide biosynthesis PqqD family chaperone [Pelagicoccus sp. SDUM812003]|uniref:lasso peptide biosynthesis PqqD family chaperone n=1 Tax=Pelagicoccus sp. SDUM812003 TaxID=3041267 RepID=UPI00280FBF99|nr:lasso peptide biosynthesis PqqD family chaperone [Pelagicoccus sp. SDUM812003]MDQ8205645.1 lasso peptide biosynthesis PqqD family chaperone [Pelagicoccus sp. SDUM812003]